MSFFEPIFLNDVVGVEVGEAFTLTSFLLPNFLKAAEFLSGVKIFVFALVEVEGAEGWFSFSLGDTLACSTSTDGAAVLRLGRAGLEGGGAAGWSRGWTAAAATVRRIEASYSACRAASSWRPGRRREA
jgi:hypothetical protein